MGVEFRRAAGRGKLKEWFVGTMARSIESFWSDRCLRRATRIVSADVRLPSAESIKMSRGIVVRGKMDRFPGKRKIDVVKDELIMDTVADSDGVRVKVAEIVEAAESVPSDVV